MHKSYSFGHNTGNKHKSTYHQQFLSETPTNLPGEQLPFFTPYPEQIKHHPTFSNYNIEQEFPITTRVSFTGNSEKNIHLGIGEHLLLQGALRWHVSRNLSVSVGGLLDK